MEQLAEFLDVSLNEKTLYINGHEGRKDEPVYENFRIDLVNRKGNDGYTLDEEMTEEMMEETEEIQEPESQENAETGKEENKPETAENLPKHDLTVTVNHSTVVLSGKSGYTFVDIFDFYPFDTKTAGGDELITKINGMTCSYFDALHEGDAIDLFWVTHEA